MFVHEVSLTAYLEEPLDRAEQIKLKVKLYFTSFEGLCNKKCFDKKLRSDTPNFCGEHNPKLLLL